MTRRWFVMTCCGLLVSATILAQSGSVDPISGTWTGEIVREGVSRPNPITLELKSDGKGAVTGDVTGMGEPADVKKGTFDAKTGALKLELGKKGAEAVLLTLEGTVAKGAATGKVAGQGTGEFKIAKK